MEKYKHNLIFMLFGAAFSIMAVVMILIAVSNTVKWNDFRKTAVATDARITNIQVSRQHTGKKTKVYHDVYITYEYNDEEYDDMLSYYSSGMNEGDIVTIYVDPEDPRKNMSDPGIILIISAVMFIVFGGIGASFFVYEIRRGIYINRLIRDDKYVFAEYTREEPSDLTVNKVRYNQSVFTYDDGYGRALSFTSRPHHPSELAYAPGESMKVYVDMENDPKKHYVSEVK
ncbi:MAG: DUF3592 domain-containing protein [Huintestinicola sp.]